MPLYDFKCPEHGYFEEQQRLPDHTGFASCLICGQEVKQVQIKAPGLDIEAMADAGMPGAFETSGDRMTERHKSADRAGDWASRDSIEFTDSAGEDRQGDFMKAFADKVAVSE